MLALWLPQTFCYSDLWVLNSAPQFFAGTKALNNTHLPTTSHSANSGDNIHFVTVFTIYNASLDSKAVGRSSDIVKVGDASYSKVERSMAILNVFINFIRVLTC